MPRLCHFRLFPLLTSLWLGSLPPHLQSTRELWAVPGAVQTCRAVILSWLWAQGLMAQAGLGGTSPSRGEANSLPLLPQ